MKKDGLLFAALALLGVGAYFFFKDKGAGSKTPATATTGSNPYAPANSFAGLVGTRGSVAAARTGAQGGASVDLSGAATAGVNALGALAKRFMDYLTGAGQPGGNVGTDPNSRVAYTPPEWVGVPPQFSTRADLDTARGISYAEKNEAAYGGVDVFYNGPAGGSGSDDFADVFEDGGSDTFDGELI